MGKKFLVLNFVQFYTVVIVTVVKITESRKELVSDCQPRDCSQLEPRCYNDPEFHCKILHKAGSETYKKPLEFGPPKIDISVPLLKKVDVVERYQNYRSRYHIKYYVLDVSFIIPFDLDNDMEAVSLELNDLENKTKKVVRLFDFSTYEPTGLDMKTPRVLNYSCFVVNPSDVYFLRFTLIPSGHQLGYNIATTEYSQRNSTVAVAILPTNYLHVIFRPAPDLSSFKGYSLELVENKKSTLKTVQSKWITKDSGCHSHVFNLTRNGKYAVRVTAYSDHGNKFAISLSPEVEFFSGPPELEGATVIGQENGKEDATKIVIAGGFGSLVGLVLISLVAVIFKKKYKCFWKLFCESLPSSQNSGMVSDYNNVKLVSTIHYQSPQIKDFKLLANQDGLYSMENTNEKLDDFVNSSDKDKTIENKPGVDQPLLFEHFSPNLDTFTETFEGSTSEEELDFYPPSLMPSTTSSRTDILDWTIENSLPIACRDGICVYCQQDNTVQYPNHAMNNNISHFTNNSIHSPGQDVYRQTTHERNIELYKKHEPLLKIINFSK